MKQTIGWALLIIYWLCIVFNSVVEGTITMLVLAILMPPLAVVFHIIASIFLFFGGELTALLDIVIVALGIFLLTRED